MPFIIWADKFLKLWGEMIVAFVNYLTGEKNQLSVI